MVAEEQLSSTVEGEDFDERRRREHKMDFGICLLENNNLEHDVSFYFEKDVVLVFSNRLEKRQGF